MRVLAVNAGSSSLKLSLLDAQESTIAARELAMHAEGPAREELRRALAEGLDRADAVGHRIVHGGERFTAATLLDEGVERELRALTELAPLHQSRSLAALDAVREALPAVPHLACFDTAFHATLPEPARVYALPRQWRERHPLRRFGFHGLSHAYVARRAGELLQGGAGEQEPPAAARRIVSCHLGAGASACAIAGGRSQDTTMGFTPLEGLLMATRSGDVDPGLLTWLMERERIGPGELADALEHRSGLLALAGSADMREVQRAARNGDAGAQLALGAYIHRLRRAIAAMAAAIGGMDALVFTGGVGERSAEVRARTCEGLRFLGVQIDSQSNARCAPDAELTSGGARVRTFVLAAREDLEIARQVRERLTALPTAAA